MVMVMVMVHRILNRDGLVKRVGVIPTLKRSIRPIAVFVGLLEEVKKFLFDFCEETLIRPSPEMRTMVHDIVCRVHIHNIIHVRRMSFP